MRMPHSREGQPHRAFRHLLSAFCLLAITIFSVMPAFAVNPDEMLADPVLEARARHISSELRCMVCQNESIDESNADLARDLRILVRQHLTAGESDQQVINYLVSRYGDFVLLKPRFTEKTWLLWGAPVILLLLGASALIAFARRRAAVRRRTSVLTVEEEARLKSLLSEAPSS